MAEMLQCHSVWVNDDKKYGKVGICNKCGKKHFDCKWQILSFKDIFVIYTTHLEMPQVPPNFHENIMDTLYFWETMIQNTQNGKFLGFQIRYQSQRDAEEGHWITYDKLEDILLNPDKYPIGIMGKITNMIKQFQVTEHLYSEETKNQAK